MDGFSNDFHDFDMQKALRLAQTDAAKQLFAMLQASSNSNLQSAMNQAAAGDMTQAKLILRQLMENPQTNELMQQLMGEANG